MDKSITLRFYQIARTQEDKPHFADVLRRISDLPVGERWRPVGDGIRVRLERFAELDGDLFGEFTREQSDNYPSLVTEEGVVALPIEPDGGELGHGVAFRFRPENTLAVQFAPHALSPSRILEYLYSFDDNCEFSMTVKLAGDEWDRFNRKPLRKLKFAIASPANLAQVENRASSAFRAARQLGADYGSPYVTISLGMGHRGGELPEAVKELGRTLFEKFSSGDADVRSLTAVADDGAGEGSDEINLIDEIVSVQRELRYRKNDPDYNYDLRKNLLHAMIPLYAR